MRHQVAGRHLSRTSGHRTALRRNLAASLFEHGNIVTTPEKAKFVRPFAEKLITKARKGTLHARRQVIAALQDRAICKVEDGEPEKVDTVVRKLFNEIGPKYAQRSGGYTRMIRLPFRRLGDNGQLVVLQLVEEEIVSRSKKTADKKADKVPAADTTDKTAVADAASASESAEPRDPVETSPAEPQETQPENVSETPAEGESEDTEKKE